MEAGLDFTTVSRIHLPLPRGVNIHVPGWILKIRLVFFLFFFLCSLWSTPLVWFVNGSPLWLSHVFDISYSWHLLLCRSQCWGPICLSCFSLELLMGTEAVSETVVMIHMNASMWVKLHSHRNSHTFNRHAKARAQHWCNNVAGGPTPGSTLLKQGWQMGCFHKATGRQTNEKF